MPDLDLNLNLDIDEDLLDSVTQETYGALVDDEEQELSPDILREALLANIAYKQGEIRYLSYNSSKPDKELKSEYRKCAGAGMNSLDGIIGQFMVSSTAGTDNTSVFSSEEDREVAILQLAVSLLIITSNKLQASESQEKSTSKVISEIAAQMSGPLSDEELEEIQLNLAKLKSEDLAEREAATVDLMLSPQVQTLVYFLRNKLANTDSFVRQLNSFVKNTSGDNKTRDLEMQNLQSQLSQLMLCKEGKAEYTVFKCIKNPAFKDGVSGFKYTCGCCGQESFTALPIIISHYVNSSSADQTELEVAQIRDFESADLSREAIRCATMTPIGCPNCGATNLLSDAFIRMYKLYSLQRAKTGFFASEHSSAVLSLTHFADFLAMHPSINVSTVVADDIDSFPHEEQVDFTVAFSADCINDFISSVSLLKTAKLLEDDNCRNIAYLRYLFGIQPNFKHASDRVSFLNTILKHKAVSDVYADLLKYCDIAVELLHAKSILQTIKRMIPDLGKQVYKDVLVTLDCIKPMLKTMSNDSPESAQELIRLFDTDRNAASSRVDKTLNIVVNTLSCATETISSCVQLLSERVHAAFSRAVPPEYDTCTVPLIQTDDFVIKFDKEMNETLAECDVYSMLYEYVSDLEIPMLMLTIRPILARKFNSRRFIEGQLTSLSPDKCKQIARQFDVPHDTPIESRPSVIVSSLLEYPYESFFSAAGVSHFQIAQLVESPNDLAELTYSHNEAYLLLSSYCAQATLLLEGCTILQLQRALCEDTEQGLSEDAALAAAILYAHIFVSYVSKCNPQYRPLAELRNAEISQIISDDLNDIREISNETLSD